MEIKEMSDIQKTPPSKNKATVAKRKYRTIKNTIINNNPYDSGFESVSNILLFLSGFLKHLDSLYPSAKSGLSSPLVANAQSAMHGYNLAIIVESSDLPTTFGEYKSMATT
jgi:hypothetical protein